MSFSFNKVADDIYKLDQSEPGSTASLPDPYKVTSKGICWQAPEEDTTQRDLLADIRKAWDIDNVAAFLRPDLCPLEEYSDFIDCEDGSTSGPQYLEPVPEHGLSTMLLAKLKDFADLTKGKPDEAKCILHRHWASRRRSRSKPMDDASQGPTMANLESALEEIRAQFQKTEPKQSGVADKDLSQSSFSIIGTHDNRRRKTLTRLPERVLTPTISNEKRSLPKSQRPMVHEVADQSPLSRIADVPVLVKEPQNPLRSVYPDLNRGTPILIEPSPASQLTPSYKLPESIFTRSGTRADVDNNSLIRIGPIREDTTGNKRKRTLESDGEGDRYDDREAEGVDNGEDEGEDKERKNYAEHLTEDSADAHADKRRTKRPMTRHHRRLHDLIAFPGNESSTLNNAAEEAIQKSLEILSVQDSRSRRRTAVQAADDYAYDSQRFNAAQIQILMQVDAVEAERCDREAERYERRAQQLLAEVELISRENANEVEMSDYDADGSERS